MDENLYFVYKLTQTDNPTSSGEVLAMDSTGDDQPLDQPLFLCPDARIKFHKLKIQREDGDIFDYDFKFHPYISSPHFPSKRSGDQQGESLLDCDEDGICKLPVAPLFWCNNKESDSREFQCGGCRDSMLSASYYACLQCEKKFHKECVESPLEIKHPTHLFHSLRLYYHPAPEFCICCKTEVFMIFYHCLTCNLSMHPVCAMRKVPFFIDHPKSHPHPLTFFPTQASLVCHFCALIKKLDPTYICTKCVFVIHKGCIGFPHVIRISRHTHRISFTSSLPCGKLSCGVCHQQVDNDYGAYSCKKCDAYFVHSKCALQRHVWDGKDLEEVPEEDDMIDDGEPFKRIADGIILHPFHSHNLHLQTTRAYDENKYCRGCALPIYEGQFYSCIESDFILHEHCANAPRMKRHPLHPHPLTLVVATRGPGNEEGTFQCDACHRKGTGFFYEHHTDQENIFMLDIHCASIFEPFQYQGHEHPLFLPSEPNKWGRCQMCTYEYVDLNLNCLECDYILCFHCATLPYKVRYKHDSHFLKICNGKEANDQSYWCEICEGKIEEGTERAFYNTPKKDTSFYKCNACCTTLHQRCLLGIDTYMKPGETVKDYLSSIKYASEGQSKESITDVQILLNSSPTRPICTRCLCRCPFPIFFKGHNTIFCSWDCVEDSAMRSYQRLLYSFLWG
ncbi:unnamed protein product [Arabidopsis thaliana]|uniref:Phorbol-ester/DAG-type domain-containing protein n=1 Tax=Arabidopsis thaliana TaxID=3702 RepID=A0A5S9XSS4_ARATH|nr:unnamed protein product [Arabidopsis thaliana]